VREGFDDTRVREEGLQKNPFYRRFSSMELALAVMSLIGVATLLGALFPQGMGEAFYLARFGDRLFRIYDSLGLLGVLRSWWFMLLFALLLIALVFCVYSRIRERAFRGARGTALFETEFSIPTPSEEVLLIFPVLLRSIGFRKKGIITEERRSEITAVKGISPSITSLLLHLSTAVLLLGFAGSYLLSWGYVARPESEQRCVVPSRTEETRWGRLMGEPDPRRGHLEKDDYLTMELLEFRKHYESFPTDIAPFPSGVPLSRVSVSREQVYPTDEDTNLFLRGWGSSLRLTRGGREETLRVATGHSRMAFDVSLSQGAFLDIAHIEFPSARETLRVTLPASIRREDVVLSMSSPLVRRLPRKGTVANPAGARHRVMRIDASAVGAGAQGVNEIHDETAILSSGDTAVLRGLPIRLLRLSEQSLIRVRYDPGRLLIKLGAVLVVLFSILRLYTYWYTLRVELVAKRGGGSHLKLKMNASGLLSSPTRVARKIASLLAK
jgi:hypothetical protein